MCNKPSTNKNNTSLAEEIDRIASKYILSQNFNDMNKLSEKGHCDKVVFLTAKIIDQNLNPLEQKEMVDRINNGNKANENYLLIARFVRSIKPLKCKIKR